MEEYSEFLENLRAEGTTDMREAWKCLIKRFPWLTQGEAIDVTCHWIEHRGRCRNCGRHYTPTDVNDMLRAMFGDLKDVDEDYWVLIYGLCPNCWPEYPG
jgi:hypothetical protein